MKPGPKRVVLIVSVSLMVVAAEARAKPPQDAAKGAADSRAKVQADYDRERTEVERRRLERLALLARGQDRAEANRTYEEYFRSAIEAGLFVDAEKVAEHILSSAASASPEVTALAVVVNFVAEADRGAFEDSLRSLVAAVDAAENDANAGRVPALPTATKLSVLEAYYQRLVQGDQFDIVRKAMTLIAEKARDEPVRAFAADRLKQLNLVGKPAPVLSGRDIDGDPVNLADFKGNVVLVVFWATWCLPNAEEADLLRQVDKAYREKGLRILGVNLDTASDPDHKVENVLPDVKRFLVEHNVSWPNLINGAGEQDFAKAYGVTEIPASVLIGRDGKVIHLDLTRSNVEKVIARAIGE